MITLTEKAIEQVKQAAEQSEAAGLALRLAAKRNADGTMEYGMGFDDPADDDMVFRFGGVEVVMNGEYGPLLKGTTIDFVEIEPGQWHFIFMNPNDANYQPVASN
ncbi:MAG: iron-sulfur cluster assembly accessory protein [Acidihalobacter sp.]|jgi:iron-sulfur cluster assembly protein